MGPHLLVLVDRLQEWLSHSRTIVRLAVMVRRATTGIIAHRLRRGGIDPEANGEAWFVRQLAPDCTTFVDVGANRGAWSQAMLAVAPQARGVLYEPSGAALDRLHSLFGDDPRVTIVSAAVGDAPGVAPFFEEPDAGETSSLVAGFSGATAVCREVQVVRLDDELERLGIDHVDVLKIDAEGYDLMVLRGARRSLAAGRIEAVQFEYNAPWALAGATLASAERLLTECGMAMYALGPGGLGPLALDWVGELFTYANFIALAPAAQARFASAIRLDALA